MLQNSAMKHKVVALILLITAFFFASQKLYAQKTSYGIKAGVNLSTVTGEAYPADTVKMLVGYHAGGFITIKLPFVSIQPELLISTAGSEFWTNDVIQEMKFTYISLPVMIKIKPLKGFYVEAGPQFSYKIAESISTSNLRGMINELDLSAGAGLGFNAGPLAIYTRYLAGLSRVGDFDSDSRPNFKNGVFQAGLSFVLKGKK